MDWTEYTWIALGSTIVFLMLNDGIWAFIWLMLLYALLHSTIEWLPFYLGFIVIYLARKHFVSPMDKIK